MSGLSPNMKIPSQMRNSNPEPADLVSPVTLQQATEHHARNRKFAFVSPGVVSLPSQDLGFSKGFLVRDPDGHVVELAEE